MFTIGALSQYKMFIIFEGICSIEKLYNIFIPTDARQASVIAGDSGYHAYRQEEQDAERKTPKGLVKTDHDD